ncbi:MAG TPA: hypothetical protein VIY29_20805, partial [Ktedonobacteraceae bacterium]
MNGSQHEYDAQAAFLALRASLKESSDAEQPENELGQTNWTKSSESGAPFCLTPTVSIACAIPLSRNSKSHKIQTKRRLPQPLESQEQDRRLQSISDLNPDEGTWQYLKRVELGNVCCTDLDYLSHKVIRARERLRHKRDIIRSCSQQYGDVVQPGVQVHLAK